MSKTLFQKLLAWLTRQPPAPVAPPEDRWAQFCAVLAAEGVSADYRELADLLWLERLMNQEPEAAAPADHRAPQTGEQAPPTPAAPVTAPAQKAAAGLPVYAPQAVTAAARLPATRVRLAGAAALPEAAAINRALRPFARRAKASQPQLFDEEATAQLAAETGFVAPVFRPAPEPWFAVALVVEDSPAMIVWRQTARELFDLLQSHNAFRTVRQYRLQFADEKKAQLPAQLIDEVTGAVRTPRSLCHAAARQLVILLTDGAAPHWADERMAQVLNQWGRHCAVVIAQVLSERLWPRTLLGWPEAEVKAAATGSANNTLLVAENWWGGAPLLPVPVIGLNPESIGRWARMLMQPGAVYRAALFAAPTGESTLVAAVVASGPEFATPAARVAHFKALVAPDTFQLAVYLSLLPLTLPVLRLVQAALLAQPRQEQLAELLLGGVVKSVEAPGPEDELEYDFYEGVREVLEKQLYTDDVTEILRLIGKYLGEHATGKFSFSALLPDPAGVETLPAARPFARFLLPALRRLGLAYLLGERDDEGREEKVAPDALQLIPFTFETVTLDAHGKVKERRTLQANQFIEELAPGVPLEMVAIPGGEFLMGAPEDEEGSYEDERPQRTVTVPPFYLGKYPVTQAQWRVVAGWPQVERELNPDPSHFKGADRPVENVSREDAQEFCARLRAKTGHAYRLPSEAEWEYACRAGTTTPFAFGETITTEIVNYHGDSYAQGPKGTPRGETIPVGSLGVANAFGLFDMHGNVWEWCEDDWHDSYESAPRDGSAWLSAPRTASAAPRTAPRDDGSNRVGRGGGWNGIAVDCRSADRGYDAPGRRYDGVGFRLVRT